MSVAVEIKCKLCERFNSKTEFNEKEKKTIADITKKTLQFLVEKGISSTPKNYRNWFNVFTYLAEHNLLDEDISDEKLIEICKELNKDEDIDIRKLKAEIQTTTEALSRSMNDIIQITEEYSKSLSKGDMVLSEATEKVEDSDIKAILGYVLEEMRRIKKENEKFKQKIEEENKKVEKLKKRLQIVETEANTDYLTGICNRRAFMNTLKDFFENQDLYKKFALILLDIDNFKRINDEFGHDAGDLVLKDVADVLKKYLRPEDIPARFGGEEFAVIVANANKEVAYKVAERLRKVIETRHVKVNEDTIIDYTASFGVATVDDNIKSVEELIKKADENLYKAKNNGKNCVVV